MFTNSKFYLILPAVIMLFFFIINCPHLVHAVSRVPHGCVSGLYIFFIPRFLFSLFHYDPAFRLFRHVQKSFVIHTRVTRTRIHSIRKQYSGTSIVRTD